MTVLINIIGPALFALLYAVGCFELAFDSSPIASVAFALGGFVLLSRRRQQAELERLNPISLVVWVVIGAAVFFGFILWSQSSAGRASNQSFLQWPYRPWLVLPIWLGSLFVAGQWLVGNFQQESS